MVFVRRYGFGAVTGTYLVRRCSWVTTLYFIACKRYFRPHTYRPHQFKLVDTCGVHNLHGLPGLLGGLNALLVLPSIASAQLAGIAITISIAIVGGILAGLIIKITGSVCERYEDSVESAHMAGPDNEQANDFILSRIEVLEKS